LLDDAECSKTLPILYTVRSAQQFEDQCFARSGIPGNGGKSAKEQVEWYNQRAMLEVGSDTGSCDGTGMLQ
jgi:hypothetical protein